MSVGLEIGSKQKVLLKNSYLTFFWDNLISRDLSRVISAIDISQKNLLKAFG